jgi:hypothetical protein
MISSRRRFLKAGSLFGLSAALPFALPAVSARRGEGERDDPVTYGAIDPYDAVRYLDKSAFESQLETKFRIRLSKTKRQDVVLVQVADRSGSQKSVGTGGECFGALFRGARRGEFPQGTYIIDHAVLGTFALLLVPVGRDSKYSYYEAFFNRTAPPGVN